MRHYSETLRERARTLRKTQTDVEAMLWRLLRSRELTGHKFRRQHPIAGYIADFVCLDRHVVIELDGSQHQEVLDYDQRRTRMLEHAGFQVLRFWNNDVIEKREGVLATILAAVTAPHPGPLPASGAREKTPHPGPLPASGAREDAPHPGPLPAGGEREVPARIPSPRKRGEG